MAYENMKQRGMKRSFDLFKLESLNGWQTMTDRPHLAGCEKIKLLQVTPHQMTFYLTFKLTWTMWHFMWHSIWHSTYSTWRSIWQIISHFIWHSYLTYVLLDIRFGSGIGELAMLFGSGKPARPYQFSEQHVSSNHHLGLASPPSSLTSLHSHFEASWCAFLRRFDIPHIWLYLKIVVTLPACSSFCTKTLHFLVQRLLVHTQHGSKK